jgi:hypothetical protein
MFCVGGSSSFVQLDVMASGENYGIYDGIVAVTISSMGGDTIRIPSWR